MRTPTTLSGDSGTLRSAQLAAAFAASMPSARVVTFPRPVIWFGSMHPSGLPRLYSRRWRESSCRCPTASRLSPAQRQAGGQAACRPAPRSLPWLISKRSRCSTCCPSRDHGVVVRRSAGGQSTLRHGDLLVHRHRGIDAVVGGVADRDGPRRWPSPRRGHRARSWRLTTDLCSRSAVTGSRSRSDVQTTRSGQRSRCSEHWTRPTGHIQS